MNGSLFSKMKPIFVFLALPAVIWAYPQTKLFQSDWQDFSLRRIFIEPDNLDSPKFDPGLRIVNGYEVSPHQIPYQVWIIFRMTPGAGGWGCGGSLITRRFVLTAAHCILWAGLAEVYLGVHNISSDETNRIIVTTKKLTGHPDYNPTNITNDVGVIDLEQEIELNKFIDVVKLPGLGDLNELYEGENARVSGWGKTAGDGNSSDVLLAVNGTVLANTDCKAVFSIFQDSEICILGSGGEGICDGDSGGPLVAGDVQIGVVSYGTRDCVYGYPSFFARVTSFLDWIVENSDYVVQ
ncbi:chymotrypsin-like [Anoplophora glabripennis]|uniref:chymotrypsin-like n=1 Tax=Anoplophora glabripennis TaxID=217634 RepID=UPI000874473B|nr:chymotrypsin-like [Anoplophora glabripennis]